MLDERVRSQIMRINTNQCTLVWEYFSTQDCEFFITWHTTKPFVYLVFRVTEDSVCCSKYINSKKLAAMDTPLEIDPAAQVKQVLSLTVFALGGTEI